MQKIITFTWTKKKLGVTKAGSILNTYEEGCEIWWVLECWNMLVCFCIHLLKFGPIFTEKLVKLRV